MYSAQIVENIAGEVSKEAKKMREKKAIIQDIIIKKMTEIPESLLKLNPEFKMTPEIERKIADIASYHAEHCVRRKRICSKDKDIIRWMSGDNTKRVRFKIEERLSEYRGYDELREKDKQGQAIYLELKIFALTEYIALSFNKAQSCYNKVVKEQVPLTLEENMLLLEKGLRHCETCRDAEEEAKKLGVPLRSELDYPWLDLIAKLKDERDFLVTQKSAFTLKKDRAMPSTAATVFPERMFNADYNRLQEKYPVEWENVPAFASLYQSFFRIIDGSRRSIALAKTMEVKAKDAAVAEDIEDAESYVFVVEM